LIVNTRQKRKLDRTSNWSVAEAKAKFSTLVDRAQSRGPQMITRRGQSMAVVVSAEEWKRKTHRTGNLADFFNSSGLGGSGIKVQRSKGTGRGVEF
jgi:prevent-host-death family protein